LPYLTFLTLLLLLPAERVGSTTLARFDLQALTENAERIFHGSCIGSGSQVIDGRPYTSYRFTVDETVKGTDEAEVTVRLLGGEQDGQRLELVGMPTFSHGEEVVLFLTGPDRRDNAWPVGLSQGKFRVERVGVAKTAVVAQQSAPGQLYPAADAAAKQASSDLGPQRLDSFLLQIRNLVNAEAGVEAH
jgi:hypothetical protein